MELLLLLLVVTAGAAAAAEAADDEDDETGDVDDRLPSVVPDTLSGAFGWPPSSGDGAILESVKRREIISGRRRQRPPPVRGRGSRNCAVPCTGCLPLPLGKYLLLLLCGFFNCYCRCSCLSLSLYQIYIISTHHTLLLPTSTCYFTATSCCYCCCCPRVFFYFTFRFRRFLLLELLRYEIAAGGAAATTSQTSFALSLYLPLNLSSFSTFSFSLFRTATALVLVCSHAGTQNIYERVCIRVFVLTHSHRHTLIFSRKEGFFLFFPLLHPLAAAGHHPSSSSFPCQPEHSGRTAGLSGGGNGKDRPYSMPPVPRRTELRKIKSARDRPEFTLLFSFLPSSHDFHTHTQHQCCWCARKKCCTHSRTLVQIFRPTSAPPKKIRLFVPLVSKR